MYVQVLRIQPSPPLFLVLLTLFDLEIFSLRFLAHYPGSVPHYLQISSIHNSALFHKEFKWKVNESWQDKQICFIFVEHCLLDATSILENVQNETRDFMARREIRRNRTNKTDVQKAITPRIDKSPV